MTGTCLWVRSPLLLLGICATVTAAAGAQTRTADGSSPWTIQLRASINPLPIGLCGVVRLQVIDPVSGGTPRNPLGFFMGTADFDLSATSPDPGAVVGQLIDPNQFLVCSCLVGKVGAVGTITASYPANRLAAKARVPGVAFQTTATFTLAAAKGNVDPTGCGATAPPTAIAGPVPGPAKVPVASPAPPAPTPIAAPPVRSAPVPLPAGPIPINVTVSGNPAEAIVKWGVPLVSGASQPTSFQVERWKIADPACCRATSPVLPRQYSNEWIDPLMSSGLWTYQVTAIYADGRRGSAIANYAYPEPETPKGFKAVQTEKNTVVLSWQAVPGAASYTVGGPPGNTPVKVNAGITSLTRTGVPFGNSTWQVAAMYQGGFTGSPQQGSPFATTSLNVLNPHFRLIAESFRVTSETVDKPLSEDGLYDEVFMASIAERQDRQGGGGIQYPIQMSMVHGDAALFLPGQRHQAGSASEFGGIRAGDVVSPIWAAPSGTMYAGSVPFVLWDGELLPGMHDLLLRPALFELDEPDSQIARDVTHPRCFGAVCSWMRYLLGGHIPTPELLAGIAKPQINIVDTDWIPPGAMNLDHLELMNKDRPIGLIKVSNAPSQFVGLTGWMPDRIVVLSSEKIEAALAAGKSTIEVRYWDHWTIPNTPPSTIAYLNGDYTLVIRIERMP